MHHTRYILGNGTLFIRGHLDISSLLFNEDEREIFWIFYLKFLLLNLDKKNRRTRNEEKQMHRFHSRETCWNDDALLS